MGIQQYEKATTVMREYAQETRSEMPLGMRKKKAKVTLWLTSSPSLLRSLSASSGADSFTFLVLSPAVTGTKSALGAKEGKARRSTNSASKEEEDRGRGTF